MNRQITTPSRIAPAVFGALRRARTLAWHAKRIAGRAPASPYFIYVVLCYRHRLLYHRVPKTGSTTINAALMAYDGIAWTKGKMGNTSRRRHRWCPLWQADAFWYRNWRRFAFVRNPWDRLVSLWAEKILSQTSPHSGAAMPRAYYLHPRFRGMAFPDFARFACEQGLREEKHTAPQHLFIGNNKMDFIGRFETFAASCEELARVFALPEDSLAWFQVRHNASRQRGPYQDYYDDATRRLVARAYARDIELFGYRF